MDGLTTCTEGKRKRSSHSLHRTDWQGSRLSETTKEVVREKVLAAHNDLDSSGEDIMLMMEERLNRETEGPIGCHPTFTQLPMTWIRPVISPTHSELGGYSSANEHDQPHLRTTISVFLTMSAFRVQQKQRAFVGVLQPDMSSFTLSSWVRSQGTNIARGGGGGGTDVFTFLVDVCNHVFQIWHVVSE